MACSNILHRYLQYRSIVGSSSVNRLSPVLDLSFTLTKFKNYSTDEYSTMDNDGMSVPPLACSFAKMPQHQHVVGVVDEDGYLVLYNIHKTGRAAVIKTWQVHANAVFDLEWLQEENKILTGSGDQTIALYDAETCQKLETFRGHASSIKSISGRIGDDAVFVSGSRDGHIMMWDKRISHKDGAIPPVSSIYNAHTLQTPTLNSGKARKKRQSNLVRDAQQSVTAVLFQNENCVISAGAVDGCLKVWDIRKTNRVRAAGAPPVHVFQYCGTNSRKHGYSSLVQDSRGVRLFASCTDDVIYQYDMAAYNPQPVQTWRGHRNSTFYVKSAISPNDEYLLSGSSDEDAYIWQINKPKAAPVVLKSHAAEVTSVAWCPNDFTKLVTLSDDTKTKFWRIYCRELTKQSLPQWFGRARRVSKERATSTVSDVQTPSASSLSFTPSTSSLPTSHKSKLQNSSKPSLTVSPQPCIRAWLKRKAQSEEDSGDYGSLLDTSISRRDAHMTNSDIKTNGKDTSCQIVEKSSDRTADSDNKSSEMINIEDVGPSATKKFCYGHSENLPNCEEFSVKSDEPLSSTSSSESSSKGRKRSHEESESTSTIDSPECPTTPCAKCSLMKRMADTSEAESVKKMKTDYMKNCGKGDIQTKPPSSPVKNCKNRSSSESVLCIQSPVKSPLKSKKSVNQNEDSENMPCRSPRKLVKRKLNADDSPVKSPKRPCLTSLETNGCSDANRCSVKVSLFPGVFHEDHPRSSSDSVSPNKSEAYHDAISTSVSLDEGVEKSACGFSTESASEKCIISCTSSPVINTSQVFHSVDNTPGKQGSKCHEQSITPSKDILTCQAADDADFNSPTRNLPNLVMDEIYGRNVTPPRSKQVVQTQKRDWLTQMRLEKMKKNPDIAQKQASQLTPGKSSPKIVKGMKKINSYFRLKDGVS